MSDDPVISLIQQLFEQQSAQIQANHDSLMSVFDRHAADDSRSFAAVNARVDTVSKDVSGVATDVRDHKKVFSSLKWLSLAAIAASISSWIGKWIGK